MAQNRSRTRAKPLHSRDLLRRILGKDTGDRRVVILRALWRLMLQKGYASTSLTDVARKARISTSHLAYYFRNKEAMLFELCRALTGGLLTDVTTHRGESPVEQLHLLASYAFMEPVMPVSDRTIFLELMGLAVHNRRYRPRVYAYAQNMIDYLREVFSKTPRVLNLSAGDTALLAASIWTGLLVNSFCYKGFDRSHSRALFRQSLLLLAGLSDRQQLSLDGLVGGMTKNGRKARQRRDVPAAVSRTHN